MSQKSDEVNMTSLRVTFTLEHPSEKEMYYAQGELIDWLNDLLDKGFWIVSNSSELETRIRHPRIETHEWVSKTDLINKDPLGKKD